MVKKWSNVVSRERHDARVERYDSRGRLMVETILMCKWDDRWELIGDLLSSFRAYPDSPDNKKPIGISQARVMTQAEKYETDASKEVIKYEESWIRVIYSQFWDIEDSIDFETETMELDHQTFRWKTSLGAKDSQLVKNEESPFYTWYNEVLTRKIQGASPKFVELLRETTGLTNKSAYTSNPLERDFAAGTLLMMDPIVEPAVYLHRKGDIQVGFGGKFGGNGFNVELRFKHKPEGHDNFWRPDADRYIAPGNDVKGGFDKLQIRDPSTSSSSWKDYDPHPKSERIDKILKDFPSNRPAFVGINP